MSLPAPQITEREIIKKLVSQPPSAEIAKLPVQQRHLHYLKLLAALSKFINHAFQKASVKCVTIA